MTVVTPLGVRHHGPGSARAVAAALEQLRPDLVLVEGAPELDAVLGLLASPAMRPPVAGLVYVPDAPARATFYPLAAFSPEWVAVRWALAAGVEVRFADLPAANLLAPPAGGAGAGEADGDTGGDDTGGDDGDGDEAGAAAPDTGRPEPPEPPGRDPIAALAAAAGFDDPERWWEDAVEHRHHGLDAFDQVREAMAEVRADGGDGGRRGELDRRREAAMRRAVRQALAAGRERVAFVCGAWHAPVLHPDAFPSARADDAALRGLPKVKVTATWVPWTNERLAYASGYGAGVASPGWYEHLFTVPGDVTVRWLAKVARLLREEQLDASPAAVVDAARLADALATLRGRPLAGLTELNEATQAALCDGSDVPLRLVADRLLVGHALGSVPPETPMVPLARDLERAQRRLRLRPSAAEQVVTLDLRQAGHLERSQLLHRLRLLDVPWGEQVEAGRTRGTFKEVWRLVWRPELSVALVVASGAGTTIEEAAASTVARRAAGADIAELTTLVEEALLADLPAARDSVMGALAERSARQHDTERLMAAVEPLARVTRYGNVRRVDTLALGLVLHGIVLRVCVGLGAACSSLDDDAAASMRALVDAVHRGLALLDDPELRPAWLQALAALVDQRGVHGAVAGRGVRRLLDAGRLEADDAGRRLSRALSRGADAAAGAAWLDGFLSGDAVLLLHDDALLAVVDGWVADVGGQLFDDLLPLLRRTFGAFTPPERRLIGERLRRAAAGRAGGAGGAGAAADDQVDEERARRAVPRLRQILGLGDG